MAKKKEIEVVIKPQYTEKGRLAKLGVSNPDGLSSQIRKDFGNAEQTKYLWVPQRAEDLKAYYGITPAAEWPFKGASRFKSNFQRIVVDTMAGNINKSLFSPENPLAAIPSPLGDKSDSSTLENIKYVEDLHNHMLFHEYKLPEVLDKAVPTSLIESFVVLHPVYEYETIHMSDNVKRWISKDTNLTTLTYDMDTDSVMTSQGEFVHSVNLETSGMTPQELAEANLTEVTFDVEIEECVKDGMAVKMINGYRFYMPLGTPGETPSEKVQRSPYVIHQLFYTLREVKDLQEAGYFEDLDPIVATVYDRQRELLTYLKLQQAGFLLDQARLEYEYVEVLKWCGRWEVNGKKQDMIVWIDKGSGQILRAEKNIFGIKPYFPIVPFPVDETPYGESLCAIIRSHVKELDLLIRTVINIALMKSAPPKFFDPASGFNPGTIGNFGPNSWIPAREPGRNILQPPSPEDPSVALQGIQFIINIIERITGVNEVIQGITANRANTTATEIQNATARSGVRFDSIYSRFKQQLRPMFNYIHKLTLRYMPEEKEIHLMGAQNKGRLQMIHKAQLQGAFEFELQGNSVVEEQGLLQKALTLFQTVGQHPYLTYKAESIYYMLFNIVKGLNPVAMDKILPKPEEVQQIEQQNQEAQRQQEQMAMQMQQQGAAGQAQMAQQQMQMQSEQHSADMHGKLQDMEIRQAEHNQKMKHSDNEHQLKLKHEAEKNAQELAMMKEKAMAQLQMQANQIALQKAKAHEQAKAATKPDNA